MTKLSPKDVTLALILFSPVCFLATAAIQQLQLVEDFVLPILHYFFLRKDVPFVMIGVMFVWTYVITASLSVLAQSAGLKDGYDNNVCIKIIIYYIKCCGTIITSLLLLLFFFYMIGTETL